MSAIKHYLGKANVISRISHTQKILLDFRTVVSNPDLTLELLGRLLENTNHSCPP